MRKKEMIKRWIYGIVGSLVLCVGTVSAQRTLSLEECREMALENNAKMKNARLDVEALISSTGRFTYVQFLPS